MIAYTTTYFLLNSVVEIHKSNTGQLITACTQKIH